MTLLNFLSKVVSFMLIGMTSIFHFNVYDEKNIEVKNVNQELDVSITNYIEKYDTKYVYNSKLPSNEERILVNGVDGIMYTILGSDEVKTLQPMVTEVIEKGTGEYGVYVGRMTGYSAECTGCSKEGYVACFTKNRQNFSIIHDGLYYQDEEYGRVRVIAAAVQKFPCGTIIEVQKQNNEPYYTVVMDRGSAMNKAWEQGVVVIDLSFDSDKDAISSNLTGRDITFKVKRWGW